MIPPYRLDELLAVGNICACPGGDMTQTIGSIIQGLMPKGTRGIADIVCPLLIKESARLGIDNDPIIEKLTAWQIGNFRKLKGKFPALVTAAPQNAKIWSFPPALPSDAFAIAASLLVRSGAYHHIEPNSEPVGTVDASATPAKVGIRRLVITKKQRKRAIACGELWRVTPFFDPEILDAKMPIAKVYFEAWCDLIRQWEVEVFSFIAENESPPKWWHAAFLILAIADRASADVGFTHSNNPSALPCGKRRRPPKKPQSNEVFFWSELAFNMLSSQVGKSGETAYYSISSVDTDVACVAPKSRTAQVGCTLRSFSHNLALLPPKGLVRCRWIGMNSKTDWRSDGIVRSSHDGHALNRCATDPFNVLIIPYPFEIKAKDFRPCAEVADVKAVWKTFDAFPKEAGGDAQTRQLIDFVGSLLTKARRDLGPLHGVIFPELALSARIYRQLDTALFRRADDIEFFCAGLFERPTLFNEHPSSLPSELRFGNFAAMSIYHWSETRGEKIPLEVRHRKHHRWRLDGNQIARYALGSSLDPNGFWWENTRTFNREVPIIAMRQGWTLTCLICEDLARVDPAQEVVRAIGPNLVIALLMDGAQIESRWPARYATVLADDPGSSVLTLTSLGLIERANACGRVPRSRAVGLWQGGALSPTQSLVLPEDFHALALSLTVQSDEEFTLDGRRDRFNAHVLNLAAVQPVKADVAPPSWCA